MYIKKESPQTQAEATGNKDTNKDTKRKRINQAVPLISWQQLRLIKVLERELI